MKNKLKIKVCGMGDPENIGEVAKLMPDYLGFIFYEKSPRFVGKFDNLLTAKNLPESIKKVGVFVNANFDEIIQNVEKYSLKVVQLHGNEAPELCQKLKKSDLEVWKAFSVDQSFDFSITENYLNTVDAFLFDSKGTGYGGHGIAFNWDLLENYTFEIPFFLAGGISPENMDSVFSINNPAFFGVDVNSKFEICPGIKNIETLKPLFSKIRGNH
ncbi:MAG: phosphoribosylanthranilate isomerase [Spirosomataceae bacterium]